MTATIPKIIPVEYYRPIKKCVELEGGASPAIFNLAIEKGGIIFVDENQKPVDPTTLNEVGA